MDFFDSNSGERSGEAKRAASVLVVDSKTRRGKHHQLLT